MPVPEGGSSHPTSRVTSGPSPVPRARLRRAPTRRSDDTGSAVKAGGSKDGASDLDDDEADDADVETRARMRDVDIGAREEPGDLIDGVETEPSAGSIHSSTPTAYEECETTERERSHDDASSDEEDSLDGDDDHPSADSSLNVLDPDHLRVLQSYGLRPQVSYESSEEANSSDLDEASYEEAVNVSIREAFGDEAVDVDSIRADLARMPPMWQAAISDSLRASQALSESPEFVHAVRAAEAADNAGIIGAALSEHLYTDSDSDSEDDDGVFPWSTSVTGSALDDAMTESTRAAADEMLRAADVSHEVASLFASRAPRGVASWEDARRGLDLDAVAAARFGNGDVSKPAPSARGFEPPCDRSFGFFDVVTERMSDVSLSEAAAAGMAAVTSTAFCRRTPRARVARTLADVSFVADLLDGLPGVDPTDARIACVLAAVTVDADDDECDVGTSKDKGRSRRRSNRNRGNSFLRKPAPAVARGIGARARAEFASGGETGESRGGRGNRRAR